MTKKKALLLDKARARINSPEFIKKAQEAFDLADKNREAVREERKGPMIDPINQDEY